MSASELLRSTLSNAHVRFGLVAQGHMPTVERMLLEGASWNAIGRAIGWTGGAVREFYGYESAAAVEADPPE